MGLEAAGEVIACGSEVRNHSVGDAVCVGVGGCIANRLRCHEVSAVPMPANV